MPDLPPPSLTELDAQVTVKTAGLTVEKLEELCRLARAIGLNDGDPVTFPGVSASLRPNRIGIRAASYADGA